MPSADEHRFGAAADRLRVVLFTDTLGDVNGVSRFIRDMGDQALSCGAGLFVVTSTRFECPDRPNVCNIPPRYSRSMPGYPTLDVVWANSRALERAAESIAPSVVHVSTPGPVGMVGRRWAMRNGLTLVGTYHTDFPAYVDKLFDDELLGRVCQWVMRWFYRPFARVLLRSTQYAPALDAIGVGVDRREVLTCGIDIESFSTRHRSDGSVWRDVSGVRAESVKVLYVGRVSVEKNLPLLVRAWGPARAMCAARGIDAQLVVVGDGPYRATMQERLESTGAVFAGFRHGSELSAMYASGDVFVFPSTTDTLGQAVMEAQASGLPAIVSDMGGPSGVVDDGITGLVVPAHTGAAGRWSGAIVELVCDAARRKRMSSAASAKIAPMTIRRSFEHFWSVHEQIKGRRAT